MKKIKYKMINLSNSTKNIKGKIVKPGDHIILDKPIKDGSLKIERIVEESEKSEKIEEKKNNMEVKANGISRHVESKSVSNTNKKRQHRH